MKIPSGFRLIALSELRHAKSACYYNSDRKMFLILIDDEFIVGPLTKAQLESFHHVAGDVMDMKGSAVIFLE